MSDQQQIDQLLRTLRQQWQRDIDAAMRRPIRWEPNTTYTAFSTDQHGRINAVGTGGGGGGQASYAACRFGAQSLGATAARVRFTSVQTGGPHTYTTVWDTTDTYRVGVRPESPGVYGVSGLVQFSAAQVGRYYAAARAFWTPDGTTGEGITGDERNNRVINQVVYTTLPVGIIQWDASYIDDPTYHIGLYVASDATITLGSGADLYAGNYVLIWRMGDV